jgi:hypothetical protein
MTPVFVDSSAIIRAVLERGLSRAAERALSSGTALVVSRMLDAATHLGLRVIKT